MHNGITILPELALEDLTPQQLKMVRHFKAPVPVREVSLVTHRNFVKKRILDALREEILLAVPQDMQHKDRFAQCWSCELGVGVCSQRALAEPPRLFLRLRRRRGTSVTAPRSPPLASARRGRSYERAPFLKP